MVCLHSSPPLPALSVALGTALHVTRAAVEPWAAATTSARLAATKVHTNTQEHRLNNNVDTSVVLIKALPLGGQSSNTKQLSPTTPSDQCVRDRL